MSLHSGWDVINVNPGQLESMACPVCNQGMEVTRGVEGPTSFAESMAKRGHLHDTFTCKSAEEDWHVQVRQLRQIIEKTPSAKLAAIYLEEVNDILFSRRATKKVNEW